MTTEPTYRNSADNAWEKPFGWLLAAAIMVNAGGLFIPILEPDGALYATIARTMARTGDFINLQVEGRDWLDKPHFPFWLAALSFRLFGVTAFAYKLPALLFWAAGGYYTWRLALSLYGGRVARLALLIYVSAAHLVISNNDVRAEPYLTGLVIGAVFHFYMAYRNQGGSHIMMGSLLTACAVMTKGPFVLITIAAGPVVDWVRTKDWRQFVHSRWWIAFFMILLFITPELTCLYLQFDRHPEKWVFGRHGVSGIRWFFWDSQFGRFLNNGPIRGSGDPFFFFHTLLWAFLPWSLVLYAAVVRKCRHWKFPVRMPIPGDAICLGAALVSFLMFSLSRFQLPHYLNILFPFFSILSAEYLHGLQGKTACKVLGYVQNAIVLLLTMLLLGLVWWYHFPGFAWLMAVLFILAGVLPFYLFPKNEAKGNGRQGLHTAVARSFWTALVTYGFVNFCLYPAMMDYQAGMQAGKSLSRQAGSIPSAFYMLREAPSNYSFTFYCPDSIHYVAMDSLRVVLEGGTGLVFLSTPFSDSLRSGGYNVQELRRFPNFHVSALTAGFLDWRTREQALDRWSLISVKAGSEDGSRGPVPK